MPLWLLFAPAWAIPPTLTNQGYLVDAAGDGLVGTHTLEFGLYEQAAAGTDPLWEETVSVDFVEGAYSVVLGQITPLEVAVLDQAPLFLALSIDSGPEMEPRHELTSVPYAILAETSVHVNGGTVVATTIEAESLSADTVTADAVTASDIASETWTGDSLVVGSTRIDEDGLTVQGVAVLDSSGTYVGPAPDPPDLGCLQDEHLVWDSGAKSWRCRDETDPLFMTSVAAGISADDVQSWEEAYGWGDHAAVGYLADESDPGFASSAAATIDDSDIGRWDRAAEEEGGGPANAVLFDPDDPVTALISQTEVDAWNAAATLPEVDPLFSNAAAADLTPADVTLLQVVVADNYVDWNATVSTLSVRKEEWNTAFSFVSAFAEYSEGGAPAQGIGSADIDDWNAAHALVANPAGLGATEWNLAYQTVFLAAYDAEDWDAAFEAWSANGLGWDAAAGAVSDRSDDWDAAHGAWSSQGAGWNDAADGFAARGQDWDAAASAFALGGSDWNAVYNAWQTDGQDWDEARSQAELARARVCPQDHYLAFGYCLPKGLLVEKTACSVGELRSGVCFAWPDGSGRRAEDVVGGLGSGEKCRHETIGQVNASCSAMGARVCSVAELDRLDGSGCNMDFTRGWARLVSAGVSDASEIFGLCFRDGAFIDTLGGAIRDNSSADGDDIAACEGVHVADTFGEPDSNATGMSVCCFD